jgi:hypothetical protein
MDDRPDESPRVTVSDWYRISGPLPLYLHKDNPPLARWREEATRAFSRVVADILWRAHQTERSACADREQSVRPAPEDGAYD